MYFSKIQLKTEKKFFVSEKIASELVTLNCPFEDQDTFHLQPMCSQGVKTFGMSIRQTFPNSTGLAVIDEYDNGAVIHISTVLRKVYHGACRRLL